MIDPRSLDVTNSLMLLTPRKQFAIYFVFCLCPFISQHTRTGFEVPVVYLVFVQYHLNTTVCRNDKVAHNDERFNHGIMGSPEPN